MRRGCRKNGPEGANSAAWVDEAIAGAEWAGRGLSGPGGSYPAAVELQQVVACSE